MCWIVEGRPPDRVTPDEVRELVLEAVPKMTGLDARGEQKLQEGS